MAGEYETLKDAATRKHIHLRTLQRWIAGGKLRSYRIPGRNGTFVETAELDELMTPILKHADNPPTQGRKRVSSPSSLGT